MKKLIISLIIFIFFIVLMIGLDYISSKFLDNKPFIALRKENNSSVIYTSLFYRVYYCKNHDGTTKRNFESLSSKFDCPVIGEEKEFYIVETPQDVYAETIEKFYEDEEYICEYNVIKSEFVNIEFKDGRVVNIKEVLEQKLIDIEILIDEGVPCRRVANE